MLAKLHLTGEAYAYGGYPLRYVHEVLNARSEYQPPGSPRDLKVCAEDATWLCVAIVRNPLDRAVSSYIHTMSSSILARLFLELNAACVSRVSNCQKEATFAEFANALTVRSQNGNRSKGDGHFMPQALSGYMRGVLYLPVEMFSFAANDSSCPALAEVDARLDPMHLAQHELAAGAAPNAEHYKVKALTSMPGSEQWPFPRIDAAVKAHTVPAYDSFWSNTTFCRHVISCLYGADLAMYVRACSQPALRQCGVYRDACDRQLARLREVCGLDLAGWQRPRV